MRIRRKIIIFIWIVILSSSLPISFYLYLQQISMAHELLINSGRAQSKILAHSAFNAILMNAGDPSASAIDAHDMIQGFEAFSSEGIVSAQAIRISPERPYSGELLAVYCDPKYQDIPMLTQRSWTSEEIILLAEESGLKKIILPGIKGDCYEFTTFSSFPGKTPICIGRIIYSERAFSKHDETISKIVSSTAFAVIGRLFIIGLIAFFFGRYLTKPLNTLIRASRRIQTGEFTRIPRVTSGDEIEELALTMGQMMESLQGKMRELETTNQRLAQALGEHQLLERIQAEIKIADEIQKALLPQSLPEMGLCRMAVRFIPMTTVSGDFYRFARVSDSSLGILVADVSGHGIPAAIIAAKLDIAFTSLQSLAAEPAVILSEINKLISNHVHDQYATACYIFVNLEKKIIRYSNAGHRQLIIHRRSQQMVYEHIIRGIALGIFPEGEYDSRDIPIEDGDRIVLFTDGITEARNNKDQLLGNSRFSEYIRESGDRTPDGCADYIMEKVQDWSGKIKADDDITLVILDISIP